MPQEQKKTREFYTQDSTSLSLETLMALQKMLENGLPPSEEETNPVSPLEVRVSSGHSRRSPWSDAIQKAFWSVRCFFGDLAYKLYLGLVRKKPVDGKSARGSG
jgi:hypothetical protein